MKIAETWPSLSAFQLMVTCCWFARGCHFSRALKVVVIDWIFWGCTRIWVFPSLRSFRLTFYNMRLKYSQITGSVCFTWRRSTVRSRSQNLEEDMQYVFILTSAVIILLNSRLAWSLVHDGAQGLPVLIEAVTLHKVWPFWEFVVWHSIWVIKNPLLTKVHNKKLKFCTVSGQQQLL